MRDGIKEGKLKYTVGYKFKSLLFFLIRIILFIVTFGGLCFGGYYMITPKASVQDKVYNVHKEIIAVDDFVVWNDNEINILDEVLTNISVNKPHLGKVLKVPGGVVTKNDELTVLKKYEYEIEDELGKVKIITKDQIFGKINYQQ